MLVQGTQMHIVTFLFICIEIVTLFYLILHRLARPYDQTTFLNILLISLLIFYNITGGLLPDDNLPGSYFIQTSLAYATGFITPCYFPYYVYKVFGLEKMKFHAYKGVFLFLVLPFLVFVTIFGVSGSIEVAKNLLVIPVLYAAWVIITLNKAIKFKYGNGILKKEGRIERFVLLMSLTPWVALPLIDFFDMGQAIEATITNIGFLTMFAYQVKKNILAIRAEHLRLEQSEKKLMTWNSTLKVEVKKRTRELEKVNEQQMNTFINLAHETKTPLTLINNYLDDFIEKKGSKNENEIFFAKIHLDKLTGDINNLFDLEKYKNGFSVYRHNRICNIENISRNCVEMFQAEAKKKSIKLTFKAAGELHIMADDLAIYRLLNNLLSNAVKFTPIEGKITVSVKTDDKEVFLSVTDTGPGITEDMKDKIFQPYFQIKNIKSNTQGMGLGLPIVKKIIEDLKGQIRVVSKPELPVGTEFILVFIRCYTKNQEEINQSNKSDKVSDLQTIETSFDDGEFDEIKKTIMLIEDNRAMLNYLSKKIKLHFNVYTAENGNRALEILKNEKPLPDLIVSDVMMDKMDGFSFAEIASKNPLYNQIPLIFCSAKGTPEDKLRGLRIGAIDYIQKPFLVKELLQKIDSILNHYERQRDGFLKSILGNYTRNNNAEPEMSRIAFDKNSKLFGLTNREADIALLVCKGQRNKAIGQSLFISEKTVAKHVQNIFEKVKVSTKIELMNKLGMVGFGSIE